MHSGDKASPSISLAGCGHHLKDGHICDENQYLFQGKLLFYTLIFSYSFELFERKSDIYSLLITVGLIYLDKKNL